MGDVAKHVSCTVLTPHAPGQPLRVRVTAGTGQITLGGDAQLQGQVLQELRATTGPEEV